MPAIRRSQPLLGTFVEIRLSGERDETELHALASTAFAELRAIEMQLSFHRMDSELTRVNQSAATSIQPVSHMLREVLTEALLLSAVSSGVFDVCVADDLIRAGLLPARDGDSDAIADWRDIELTSEGVSFRRSLRIDLGGIAKGYAVDRAFACVPDDVDVCINAGGDLRMRPWHGEQIAIRLPDGCGARSLPMREAALATSVGSLGAHASGIVDPRTHAITRNAQSYSVWAATAMRADALTKLACLASERADWLISASGQAIALDVHGEPYELTATTPASDFASA